MVGTTVEAAVKARLEGAVPSIEVAEELSEFRNKWGLPYLALVEVLDIPEGTLNSVLYRRDRPLVERKTYEKIKRGMRNYNPRTCRHRRLVSAEVFPVFERIRVKHGLKWAQLAEIVGVHRYWMTDLKRRPKKLIPAEDLRVYMGRYHDWLRKCDMRVEQELARAAGG